MRVGLSSLRPTKTNRLPDPKWAPLWRVKIVLLDLVKQSFVTNLQVARGLFAIPSRTLQRL